LGQGLEWVVCGTEWGAVGCGEYEVGVVDCGELGEDPVDRRLVAGGVEQMYGVGEGGLEGLAGSDVRGVQGVQVTEAGVELLELDGAGLGERAAGGLAVAVGGVYDLEVEGPDADAQALADGDRGAWSEPTAGDAQAVGAAEVDEAGALLVGLEHGVFMRDVGVGEVQLAGGAAADPHGAVREAVIGGGAAATVADADLQARGGHGGQSGEEGRSVRGMRRG